MGVLERDPDATARQLEAWLTEVAGLAEVAVDQVTLPTATGWSNETVLFDARWHDAAAGAAGDATDHRLVARIAPSSYTVFPDDTFATQHEIMGALARHTDVPMAAIHWFEADPSWFGQPFWIMERVDGDIATDAPPYAGSGWLAEAGPEDQARAWWSGIEAMAAVHRVDVAGLGLRGLVAASDPVGAQLDLYERFLAWGEEDQPHHLARRALVQLRATTPDLPALGPTLCWGDARLSNLIYRDFEVAAVLDWEMAAISDPLLDLGWWLFSDEALTTGSGCTRLGGFADRRATAARWSALTGRATDALDWYELFGGLRFTVIMLRMGKLFEQMGLMPGDFAYDNLISQALARRLDAFERDGSLENI